MTKKNQNFTMVAGESRDIRVMAPPRSDLTAASAIWVLRKNNVSGTLITTKTTSSGITISDRSLTVRLQANETSPLVGKYYHQLNVTNSAGTVTSATGFITFEPSGI